MDFLTFKWQNQPCRKLKNFVCTVLVSFLFTVNTNAQVVDKSINGVQTGLLGIWWHNESRLAKNWAFRTEIGYEAPYFVNEYQYLLFLPVASIEPRWYYNSRKRQGNSNNTFHNSSNFAAIAVRYYPRFLAYSPIEYENVDGGVFLYHSWGMRRNINYKWNIEFGAGIGVDPFLKNREVDDGDSNWVLNLTLRIGYKYGMKE